MAKAVRVFATMCVALLGASNTALARTEVVIGAGTVWPGPVVGPYPPYPYVGYPYGAYPYPYGAYPYPYGAYAPWGPCLPGTCVDDIQLRRAVRRELERQELRRELEQREGGGYPRGTGGPYVAPRPAPPPTPESHLQPRYRGSGDVRPEYLDAGQQR